jgi:3'-5' exoribonuclease
VKSPFIRELRPDEIATAVFLVQSKEIRQKRTGEPYLSLTLSDRSGEIDSKMWDNVSEVMDTFERDDFVKVKGLMQLYNNRPQFTVHKLRRVEDQEIDFRDFFAASERDPDVMWSELRATVSALDNSHIRRLLDAFLDDPDIAARYRVAPAAKTIHHAFRSGLLEHVISLCGLARLVASHYRSVDINLLMAGVVLHDIGKIHELSYDRGFGYSPEGQLVGHIAIGIRMLSDKLRDFPDFPVELRNLLEHMVLSHHGQLEFGSPKVPIFPEALLLHYIDDMDSKMECMRALLAKEPQSEGFFTGYSGAMERVALRKSRYLEQTPAPREPGKSENDSFDDSKAVTPEAGSSSLKASTSTKSGSPPLPADPDNRNARASNSFFGVKLMEALHDERK